MLHNILDAAQHNAISLQDPRSVIEVNACLFSFVLRRASSVPPSELEKKADRISIHHPPKARPVHSLVMVPSSNLLLALNKSNSNTMSRSQRKHTPSSPQSLGPRTEPNLHSWSVVSKIGKAKRGEIVVLPKRLLAIRGILDTINSLVLMSVLAPCAKSLFCAL